MNGPIFEESVLIVVQEFRGGFWAEYDLFDQHWRQIGTARREDRSVVAEVADIGVPALQVFDSHERLVLSADLSAEHVQRTIVMTGPDGEELGAMVRTGGVLKPVFALEFRGRPIGSIIAADRLQRVLHVNDEAGTRAAEIRTMLDDEPFEVRADTEAYYLHHLRELPDPLRALVVGSTVVMQSVIGSEEVDAPAIRVTIPWQPAILARLKRRFRG